MMNTGLRLLQCAMQAQTVDGWKYDPCGEMLTVWTDENPDVDHTTYWTDGETVYFCDHGVYGVTVTGVGSVGQL